jgi:hypothetical protein
LTLQRPCLQDRAVRQQTHHVSAADAHNTGEEKSGAGATLKGKERGGVPLAGD